MSYIMEERLIIAKNIKLLRQASNYTQESVASFLGIGRSAYSNYESGDRDVTGINKYSEIGNESAVKKESRMQ